jgi:hypothetical protein
MDPVKIPGCAEMRMPDVTWAEVLAWFAENGVDLDLCPPSHDITVTNTIDRWQTRSEHAAGPARFVSTPVTVPLPEHLRAAIVRAVTGQQAGALRTPDEWCAQYGVRVLDPRGWRDQSWHIPLTEDEFVHRTSLSRLAQTPSTSLLESIA